MTLHKSNVGSISNPGATSVYIYKNGTDSSTDRVMTGSIAATDWSLVTGATLSWIADVSFTQPGTVPLTQGCIWGIGIDPGTNGGIREYWEGILTLFTDD